MSMSKDEFINSFNLEKKNKVQNPPPTMKMGGAPGLENKKRNQRTDWTPGLAAELKCLYQEGLSELEIAERLGVDALAVKNKITRLGLRAPKKAKAIEDSADKIYIKQLEELLKERTEEAETLKHELAAANAVNEQLAEEYKLFRQKAEQAIIDASDFGAMEEIYAIADCLGAINLNDLTDCKSAQYLICRILDIANDSLVKERQRKEGELRRGNDSMGDLPKL